MSRKAEGCAATKTFFEPRPQALIWIFVKNYKSKALLPSEDATRRRSSAVAFEEIPDRAGAVEIFFLGAGLQTVWLAPGNAMSAAIDPDQLHRRLAACVGQDRAAHDFDRATRLMFWKGLVLTPGPT